MDSTELHENLETIYSEEYRRVKSGDYKPDRYYIDIPNSDSVSVETRVRFLETSSWYPIEDPKLYKLDFENLDLLRRLYGRINHNSKLVSEFKNFVLGLSEPYMQILRKDEKSEVSYLGFEWAIRENMLDDALDFLKILTTNSKGNLHVQYGLEHSLHILGAILSVEYPSFSREELRKIKNTLRSMVSPVMNFLASSKYDRVDKIIERLLSLIVDITYVYIKAELKDVNLEINQDKLEAVHWMKSFGFSKDTISAFEKIDRYYLKAEDEFDNKTGGDLLRAYWLQFIGDVGSKIETMAGEKCPTTDNWNEEIRKYLKKHLKLNEVEDSFITKWYRLLNNKLVHKLKSKKAYFRLMKNVNIEMSLLFIYYLQQLESTKPSDQ